MERWWWRHVAYALAERQRTVMTALQLRRRGVCRGEIQGALQAERIHIVHRGVYSLVPPQHLTPEARLAAAVLLGGDGARLDSHSAARWLDLTERDPAVIHVATFHDRAETAGIRWHRLPRDAPEPYKHLDMPVTAPLYVPISVAAELSLWELKGVLAELEFRFRVQAHELEVTRGRGRRGSAKLGRAIAEHTPLLAETESHLEDAFLEFVIERGFVAPDGFNRRVGCATVDVDYRRFGVVVELDGVRGHEGQRRILRDHRRDLHRRADGLLPLRYHYAQVMRDRDLVEADLERAGIPRVRARAA